MFREIKSKLQTQFIHAEVLHVSGVCNKPAHVLAALGAGLDHDVHRIWFVDYPVDVTRVLTGDTAVS